MARLRSVVANPARAAVRPVPLVYEYEVRLNGRAVVPGQEITVRGMGRGRFVALVTNTARDVTWVNLVDRRGGLRSCSVDAVTTVHRLARLRGSGGAR